MLKVPLCVIIEMTVEITELSFSIDIASDFKSVCVCVLSGVCPTPRASCFLQSPAGELLAIQTHTNIYLFIYLQV